MNKTVRKGSSAQPESELHARIRSKGILIGCGIESLHPAATELAGMIGFDLVWGDLEHGAASPHQVEVFCIAAKAGGAWPIVRVSFTERAHIMRALEAGARLIAVPMVENAATARRIVEFGKYRPTGNRGFAASTRGVQYGMGSSLANIDWANRETHLFPQIETVQGLRRCREIVGVEGVSGAVIGPSDLSISLGRPLNFDDPKVIRAVSEAVRITRAANKIAVCVSAHPPLVRAAAEAGAQIFISAGERSSLRVHWQQVLKSIQALAGRGGAS
jgi:4-hydroxy-2-oxoheptanedioate aldolase